MNIRIFMAKYNIAMEEFVGRHKEIATFERYHDSPKSEFVAVYGRRRIGKTFLIHTLFKERMSFEYTGRANLSFRDQIYGFKKAMKVQFNLPYEPDFNNWIDAFLLLQNLLSKKRNKRKVIFIDELPWLDTPRSGFISAFEHFWNSWANKRDDILLIVCGSATSWMLSKIINNKGGLHNRVTRKMRLQPFTLSECEALLKSHKVVLDRYQIIQLYMVMGGVPYYWDAIEPGCSAMQSIDNICFKEDGLLVDEFQNLFASLFKNAEKHERLIEVLAIKSKGLTRNEIIKYAGVPTAGSLTRVLKELELSGFIKKYSPFEKKMRNSLYQVVDFYSLFYLKFIKPFNGSQEWLTMVDSPAYRAWSGYAYEQVCMAHLPQIKKALGISGVQCSISSWRSTQSKPGAQIDLLIDRKDQVVNLCEMKFSINEFELTSQYAAELRHKVGAFKAETKTRKSVFMTMLTTFGLKENPYSGGIIQNELSMDDLFQA